jgi:(4S)-4-hydroxy-5-phosphonooxypentane-2,3-dione isomerase
MYIVTVEFVAKPERTEAFRAAIVDNAGTSRHEPGCRQFDVCCDPGDRTVVFLYEVYDDRAAFDAHCASAHFLAFDDRVRDWIDRKTVRTYERIDP